MKRVALAWEQGGNAGHALRLCRLCDELERAGAAPVWALPPHRLTVEPIASDKRPHVTAPNVVAGRVGAVLSFADLLVAQGFLRREYLVQSIREWHAIWKRERIDALVSDYAPVAQLAALLAGMPVLQVTNGFDCPSPDVPIFGTRFGGEYFVRRNATTVAALERSLDDVGREFHGRVSLRDLFGSPRCTTGSCGAIESSPRFSSWEKRPPAARQPGRSFAATRTSRRWMKLLIRSCPVANRCTTRWRCSP